MKVCIVIPVYNHQRAIGRVIHKIRAFELPCYLINDGSDAECSAVLQQIAAEESEWITLIERAKNGGKGVAVIDGLTCAIKDGLTHAIQVDSDGQHTLGDIGRFLHVIQTEPDKLILGQPIFDESVPKKRLYGRQLTNVWVWINTLSFAIADGMCGFRCYPLAAVEKLLVSTKIGQRMDFDIDIAVRLYWQGLETVNLGTKVKYPLDGVSHFKMLSDNFLISKKHTQLFFGMLLRFPKLILRHF